MRNFRALDPNPSQESLSAYTKSRKQVWSSAGSVPLQGGGTDMDLLVDPVVDVVQSFSRYS